MMMTDETRSSMWMELGVVLEDLLYDNINVISKYRRAVVPWYAVKLI